MTISNEQVQHIARLARLKLDPEEAERLKADLSGILGHFALLDELDTSTVEPMRHVVETHNVLRDDAVRPSLPQADALRNAPNHDGQHFLVPGVFEEDTPV